MSTRVSRLTAADLTCLTKTRSVSVAIANESGWAPTEFNVVVLPDKIEERTKGGVFLPQQAKDRDQHAATAGVLVAVSPLAFSYADWPEEGARKPQVGDRVLFARYAGSLTDTEKPDGYRIIKDKDILAVRSE